MPSEVEIDKNNHHSSKALEKMEADILIHVNFLLCLQNHPNDMMERVLGDSVVWEMMNG
jgi:hypothetical protein